MDLTSVIYSLLTVYMIILVYTGFLSLLDDFPVLLF